MGGVLGRDAPPSGPTEARIFKRSEIRFAAGRRAGQGASDGGAASGSGAPPTGERGALRTADVRGGELVRRRFKRVSPPEV